MAFIGSSNLSESALLTGVEWSYRTVSSAEGTAFESVVRGFEDLFHHPATKELSEEWIERYRARRRRRELPPNQPPDIDVALEPREVPQPHEIQQEALQALAETRAAGNHAGLVVLATGLGKTWLAAFDSANEAYAKVLFVAHREEILHQARDTFRRIRPEARLGFYKGQERDTGADVVFASIQTLGRNAHLERFARDAFDYVVVDEFHHAEAPTYKRLIAHFRPKFLLGLTATPERSDGGNLLALCGENLVYRCDLIEGVRRDRLCRFRYFGVPDDVDYRNIPWRNSHFDEEELTRHVATRSRAQNAYEQLKKRGGSRVLAFCVSQRHAEFMADFFREQGLRARAVHSGESSAPRAQSLDELSAGHLDVICAVDMFNEGLDLPELDTVLMLRPTESRILWLQQFGRGLRKTSDEKLLTVIDYIGNHRTFLLKPQTLFNLGADAGETLALLERARTGALEIAPGCWVTYEVEAIDILRQLARVGAGQEAAFKRYFQDFVQLNGARPMAVEAFHEGYNPRALRQRFGSWLSFVKSVGALSSEQATAFERHQTFLRALEVTPMVKSYKMLVLLAQIDEAAFPGEVGIEELGTAVTAIASRNQALVEDLGPAAATPHGLRQHLECNPIAAWSEGQGMGGTRYFAYEGGRFRTTFEVVPQDRAPLRELVREIAEWRLAEYLARDASRPRGGESYACKVSHAAGKPILFLPSRDQNIGLPLGRTHLLADGTGYEADFVKVALNVARRPGERRNRLPEILRGWFGPDAGLPGTRHEVRLERTAEGWTLRPVVSVADELAREPLQRTDAPLTAFKDGIADESPDADD